jgi:hypothetical protein
MTLTVTSPPWQQVNMPALDLRRYLGCGLVEGVTSATDLVAVQRAAGANMSVDIGAGEALIQGDSISFQGRYYVLNDATFNLTGFSAAHATLPRIDRVTLRIRDAFHGDAANDVSFQIITGTATSGATLANLTGAGAVPASQLLLANVLIPAAATSITTGNIDSTVRPLVTPVPPGTELAYTEFATNVSITATTVGTAQTIVAGPAIVIPASTPIWVEFFCPAVQPPASSAMAVELFDAAADVTELGEVVVPASVSYAASVTRRKLTPAAGTHTYTAKGYLKSGSGTGVFNAGTGGVAPNLAPGYIRVTRG